MKILIVGSTSVVGSALGRRLGAERHSIYYAGRKNADFFLDLEHSECVLPGDPKFDVVIHVAADFGGGKEEDIARAERVNALGTLGVCRLAKRSQSGHLLVISSISASFPTDDPYFGPYALSKRHADELAMYFCSRYGLPLTILRPSQIYDAESRCKNHQGLFYSIIDCAQKGEDIVFHGKNDALRNYIYIDDIAEIAARTIEMKLTGLYHCTAKKSVRLSRIARMAFNAFKTKGKVMFDPEKPGIPDLRRFSGEDLFRRLGYEPRTGMAEGIRKIKAYREKP